MVDTPAPARNLRETLRVFVAGDIMGRAGRQALRAHLPMLRDATRIDLVIVNGENAASGLGITRSTAEELFQAGAQVITSGNHVWRHKEVTEYLERQPRLLRPLNYPHGAPGQGSVVVECGGWRVGVLNLQGRVFMDPVDCPFRAADTLLKEQRLGREVDAWIVDFHAEATSEKCAMGLHLDGRVSAVVGTHTHIPTADQRILPRGTGYMTDIGMSGCYDSVIGMEPQASLRRFLSGMPERFEVVRENGTLSGVVLELDRNTGLCRRIEPLRRGGALRETTMPF